MNNISKTFCILPWIHAATYTDGTALLCCVAKGSNVNLHNTTFKELQNSNMFRDARLKMLAGEQVKNCSTCYKEEIVGIRSHRQIENYIWEKKLGREYLDSIISKTKNDGSLNEDIITLDLRLGNTCNLQCIMCRPVDSSKWVKHAEILSNELLSDIKVDWQYKVADYNNKYFEWYKDKEFLQSFYDNAKNIKHIIFGGGEPLYIKEHKEIIKNLVELRHSENIELRYHTNGTIFDTDVVKLWESFKHVEVMISLDGHEHINDYIRYPSKWEVIKENLQKYDDTKNNIQPKILCTVQALNIFYLVEFCDWLLEQNFKKISKPAHGGLFHPGILHYPPYLSSKVLSRVTKHNITKKIREYMYKHKNNHQIQKFDGFLELMNSENWYDKYPQLVEYCNKLDDLRGTNKNIVFKEIFND